FREIVSSAMDAIVVFDASNRITMVNSAAERMFGRRDAEVVGQTIESLFPEQEAAHTVAAIRAAAERASSEASARPESLTARRATGETFPVEASISSLDAAAGRTYTLIARDVSERIAHEQALEA